MLLSPVFLFSVILSVMLIRRTKGIKTFLPAQCQRTMGFCHWTMAQHMPFHTFSSAKAKVAEDFEAFTAWTRARTQGQGCHCLIQYYGSWSKAYVFLQWLLTRLKHMSKVIARLIRITAVAKSKFVQTSNIKHFINFIDLTTSMKFPTFDCPWIIQYY